MKPKLVVTDGADTVTLVPMHQGLSMLTLSRCDNAVRVLVSADDMRKLAATLMTAAREMEEGK